MQKLLICTHNQGKFIEISEALKDTKIKLVSLKEIGIDFKVEEVGETYEENAILKAKICGSKFGLLALADDAGIEVAALNGAPGVNSRRFFKTDMEDRNRELLNLIKEKPDKSAKFVAVVAVYDPKSKSIKTFRGEEEGLLVEPRGKARVNLGYDTIFLIPELNQTYAEIGLEEKMKRSHRAQAAKKAAVYIKTLL